LGAISLKYPIDQSVQKTAAVENCQDRRQFLGTAAMGIAGPRSIIEQAHLLQQARQGRPCSAEMRGAFRSLRQPI
jgi:hypothetical protein